MAILLSLVNASIAGGPSGADLNQKNFRGVTVLMIAAVDGTISVVRYLLEKGADLNARDKDGYTALNAAEAARERSASSDLDDIIQLLRSAQTARAR